MINPLEEIILLISLAGAFITIPVLLILGLTLTIREILFYCNTRTKMAGLVLIALLYLWGLFSYAVMMFVFEQFGESMFSAVIP